MEKLTFTIPRHGPGDWPFAVGDVGPRPHAHDASHLSLADTSSKKLISVGQPRRDNQTMVAIAIALFLELMHARAAPSADEQDPTSSVSRSVFTSRIVNREPVDQIDSLDGQAAVLFFSELRGLSGTTVSHVWSCEDGRSTRVAFDVGGPRWRVWSRRPSATCQHWRVSVEAGGRTLMSATIESLPVISIDVLHDFKYVAEGWPMHLAAGQSPAGGLSPHPSETLIAEPTYQSPSVLYGYLPLGDAIDRRVTFVVDRIDGSMAQVWVDRNNNEDLTDDPGPFLNQGTGLFAAHVEAIVSFSSDTSHVYDLWLWLSPPLHGRDDPGWSRLRPLFYALGHYSGTVTVLGESYRAVAFEQRTYDGRFEDGDVCIDLNHDSRCSKPGEIIHDGQRLSIGGRIHLVRLRSQ